jgi:hypothetical protein
MLNIVMLMIAYTLAIMFIMSVIDKINNWNISIVKLEEYRLTPKKLNKFIIVLLILTETYLGVVFFVNWVTVYNISLYLLLMMVYTSAVLINIYRGNIFISCGCGGMLEREKLSSSIVIRNITLMLMGLLLLIADFSPFSVNFQTIMSLISATCLILLYGSVMQLKTNIDLILKLRKKISIFED